MQEDEFQDWEVVEQQLDQTEPNIEQKTHEEVLEEESKRMEEEIRLQMKRNTTNDLIDQEIPTNVQEIEAVNTTQEEVISEPEIKTDDTKLLVQDTETFPAKVQTNLVKEFKEEIELEPDVELLQIPANFELYVIFGTLSVMFLHSIGLLTPLESHLYC